MEEYKLKNIIVGLRENYKQIQLLLETMKKTLRVDDDYLVNTSEVFARVENKHRIEFYVPSVKKKHFQLLGGFSTLPTSSKNFVWPEVFNEGRIITLNQHSGVVIDPIFEKAFLSAGQDILNSELVTKTPIKATEYDDRLKSHFYITPNTIRFVKYHNGFTDSSVDYIPESDELRVATDFDEAHSILLKQALENTIPAMLFPDSFRDRIENNIANDLEVVSEGCYYHTSKYGFVENEKGYSLKRTYGKSHF